MDGGWRHGCADGVPANGAADCTQEPDANEDKHYDKDLVGRICRVVAMIAIPDCPGRPCSMVMFGPVQALATNSKKTQLRIRGGVATRVAHPWSMWS